MNITSFNKGWRFFEDRGAFKLVWSVPQDARVLDLPHDAMIMKPARPDSPNGRNTGFRNGGQYVYVKSFELTEDLLGKTILLRFDGVYMNASVFVNGQRAAFHPYGYTAFEARLDPFLKPGTDNEIRVVVNNAAMSNSRWYSGSGIYRDVWLCVGEQAHLQPLGVQLRTLHADENKALLGVSVTVSNLGDLLEQVSVQTRVLDAAGHEVARHETPAAVLLTGENTFSNELEVASPALWSEDSPVLYTCETTLLRNGRVLDMDTASFGIRTIRLDPDQGLLINGKATKLRGACVHHDHGPLGAVSSYDAEYRRVKKLKDASFNALRMAHHPAGPDLLRACDALGVYVMDEAFDLWTRAKNDHDYAQYFDDWWEDDLRAMSTSNYNHPSVILLSIGNEIPEIATKEGLRLTKAMTDLLHKLDPDRPVLASVNGVFAAGDALDKILSDLREELKAEQAPDWNVNDFLAAMARHMGRIVRNQEITRRLDNVFEITDVAGYNYMAPRYLEDAEKHPGRFMVGSETYPPDIAGNWAQVKQIPRLLGDFTWTGWDYIGEAGVGCPSYGPKSVPFGLGYPCQLAYCGDFDLIGTRRPLSYLREIVFGFRTDPYIAIQNPGEDAARLNHSPWMLSDALPRWTWPGHEGQSVVVEVYAPGDTVELFQNGISQGQRPAGEVAGYRALFDVAYQPGTLRAVCYQDGEIIGESTLGTAGEARQLEIKPCLRPEGKLVYAEFALLDAQGQLASQADIPLTVTVSGGARLLGLGTGNPMPAQGFCGNEVTTFQGRALAILGLEHADSAFSLRIEGAGLSAELNWPQHEDKDKQHD